MNNPSNALPVAEEAVAPKRLNPAILLSIYLIIPAISGFMLIDYALTGLRISRGLDLNAQSIILIGLAFQSPHAFASLLLFFDSEYLREYKGRLAISALLSLGSLCILWFIGIAAFTLFLATYTFYHQSSQQAGVATLLAKNKARYHNLWRWMSFIIFFIGLFGIIIKTDPAITVFSVPVIKNFISIAAAIFLALYLVVSLSVARESKTTIGKAYVLANTLMFIAYICFFLEGFYFYMILVPVFVHDMTAFSFYINHNANRNNGKVINFVSRIRNIVAVPELLLTPLAGIVCGTALFFGANKMFYAYVAVFINVMHFYLEGIMWKKGSLHRKSIII